MLFRPNRAGPRIGFFGRAFAPIRVLGASVRSLFPGGGPARICLISILPTLVEHYSDDSIKNGGVNNLGVYCMPPTAHG